MAIDKRLKIYDNQGNEVDYDILATDVKFANDGKDLPTKLAELEEEIGEGGGYEPPVGGIPATDLAPAVQTSLGKADTAYQKPASGIPATDLADGVIPDVSGFATKTEVNTGLAGKVDKNGTDSLMTAAEHTKLAGLPTSTELGNTYATKTELADKVDKVTGKGLSTNDYTDAEKSKLAGIAAGAEVNVNADWNASSGDAAILNKPTLSTVATSGSYNDLSDKPTIPTVPQNIVQSVSINGGTAESPDQDGNVDLNVTPGQNGKSAYEIAVENGFEGNEAAWLASLKGEAGATGSTGATGPQGPQGPQGNSGVASADEVIVVNNLTEGGTTETEEVDGETITKVKVLSAEQGKKIGERIAILGGQTVALTPVATIDNKLIKPDTGVEVAVGAATSLAVANNNSNKVSYYAITGGALSVNIGTGAKTTQGYFAAFAKRLDSTIANTKLYLAATDKCTSAGIGAEITLSNYNPLYKYLFIGHFEGSVNVVEESIPEKDLDLTKYVKGSELSKPISLTYTAAICTINGEFIRTTGLTNSNASFKRSDYLDISDYAGGKLTFSTNLSNSSVCFAFYDADHDVLSVIPSSNQSSAEYDVPADAKYVRFSTGTANTLTAVFAITSVKGFVNKVDDSATAIEQLRQTSLTTDSISVAGTINYNQDDCTIYGAYPRYSPGTSAEINDSSSAAAFRMSDYLPVYGNTYSFSLNWTANSSNNAAGAVFYDKNKTRISAIRENATDAAMPSGAAFVRLAVNGTSKTTFFCSVSGLGVINELPVGRPAKKHYNVLCIGNSFCGNMLTDLQDLIDSLKFPNLSAYNLEATGTTISTRWSEYVNGTTRNLIRYVGTDSVGNAGTSMTIKAAANFDWDFIVLQMFDTSAGDYTAYSSAIVNLISHLRHDCPNKDVKIGVHMEWPRGAGYSGGGPDGLDGYNTLIAPCAKSLIDYKFIDFVIPTGTAVMNAAFNTTLNTDQSETNALFLKDKLHLATGVGRYLSCCCFWETLMRPLTNISVVDSRVTIASTSGQVGSVALTDNNRYQAHAAVLYAVSNPFMKSDMTFDGMEEPTSE